MPLEPIKTESGSGRPANLNGGSTGGSPAGGIAPILHGPGKGAAPFAQGGGGGSEYAGGPTGITEHKGGPKGSPLR